MFQVSFNVYCLHTSSSVQHCHGLLIRLLFLTLQQLMRERQQMASRPFASVAVVLDATAERMDLMQPMVDVSPALARTHRLSVGQALYDGFLEALLTY